VVEGTKRSIGDFGGETLSCCWILRCEVMGMDFSSINGGEGTSATSTDGHRLAIEVRESALIGGTCRTWGRWRRNGLGER
jgi:hypothetical protein